MGAAAGSPSTINSVVLTHAHIDHTGYLPRLVHDGFHGPVYATPGTVDLSHIMLPDSARLQEEEADYANRAGYSRHNPALPLYSESDAKEALKLFHPINYDKHFEVTKNISFKFVQAGHILGSSFVSVDVNIEKGVSRRILFSGDIGRYNEPIINDPSPVDQADYIVLESTYGDRAHPNIDIKARLAEIITTTAARGGHILIPAFAVGRTQQLVYLIRELEDEKRIPILPVFVDSPMAVNATKLYLNHKEDHDVDMLALEKGHRNPLATHNFNLAKSVQESKNVSAQEKSTIVISASGMATGGRILHHLRKRLPDERNTIIFVGFQAAGTRGRKMVEHAESVKIFGEYIPVKAQIEELQNLSAHGDYNEILRWLGGFKSAPQKVFLVHGEPKASAALKAKIEERFHWQIEIPAYGEKAELK